MNPKTTKRLEALLATFDSGAVQPEELIRAIDAVMDVVKQSQEALLSKVDTTDSATQKQLQELEADMASAFERIASQTKTLSTVSATKDEIASLKREVSAELARVSALIPELPDEFDATDIYQSIEAHKGLLDSLSTLIVGENIRNALEALPEGEKLAIDAIENLREELDKRQARQNTTALIARRLDQIGDVDIAGVTDGQVLTYNATTKRWEAENGGAGGGYTNLTEFVDQTAWRVFYSNGSGDVTELALGADGTYLKSNGTTSAPSFATPAGVGGGIVRSIIITSGNYTAGATSGTDYVYLIAGAHTGTLPTAVGNTNRYTFKNNHSAAVTLDGDGTETIDGTANIQIAPEDSVDLISDNSNWRVI